MDKPAGACNVCTRAAWDKGEVGKTCGRPLGPASFDNCPGKIVKLPLKLRKT